jgi:hypothetical protein
MPTDEESGWKNFDDGDEEVFRLKPKNKIESEGAKLLDDIYTFLGKYVVYPSEAARVAHALWVVHAHLMEAWDSTPRLAFLSPEPESGKSRAIEVTELLVPHAIHAINVTSSYLFRKIGDSANGVWHTILYDEIDTIFGPKAREHEEIRGLINAGHRRGAISGRCVVKGRKIETEEIPAFGAVAMAGLGNLPDTIRGRSIIIAIRRRTGAERIEPFRRRKAEKEGRKLRERIEAWADRVEATIGKEYPDMPSGIDDRDADVWEAPLAIAHACGPEWGKKANKAATQLVAEAHRGGGSLGIQLLAHLKVIFRNSSQMSTKNIIEELLAMEEAPWGDIRGKPIDGRILAKYLKPYGIQPEQLREPAGYADLSGRTDSKSENVKGYRKTNFADAWSRYVPDQAKTVEDQL